MTQETLDTLARVREMNRERYATIQTIRNTDTRRVGRTIIMILNKDHKFYDLFRKCAVSAMKLKPRQIRKELDDLAKTHSYQPLPVIYRYCLMAELERRKIKKGGAA